MTAQGVMQKDTTIKMSEYWQEQLSAMPYLSSKYPKLQFTYTTYQYREARQDSRPAQDQEQAHRRREEEEEGPDPGHLLCLCRAEQEEATTNRHGAASEHPELGSGSLAAAQLRSSESIVERASTAEQRRQDEPKMKGEHYVNS